MSRRAIIRCVLSILMLVYLLVAVSMTRSSISASPFTGIDIKINDTLNTHFVSAADVNALCGGLVERLDTLPRNQINTLELENILKKCDRIEDASCIILSNGILSINVTPMIPVARVFTDGGDSYYVSAGGKRIDASHHHSIDVPVVSGHIKSPADVMPMLPLFAKLNSGASLSAWASSVTITAKGDIVIIPSVVGHTVTLGDVSNLDSKIDRIKKFYKNVMPSKGWDYYEDISVKWSGRVVATRRDKKPVDNRPITELDGIVDEILDDETMLVTTTASTKSESSTTEKTI